MNGIKVPNEFKGMLREGNDWAHRKATIKEYVQARPGEVIKGAEFVEITGTTGAMVDIRKLISQGHLTRKQVHNGQRGHAYSYKWHETPLPPKSAALSNGSIFTRNLGLPDIPMDPKALKDLDVLFLEWLEVPDLSAENIKGVVLFKTYVRGKVEGAVAERESILNGGGDDKGNNG
jgi:hypothetical protein